jgi:predicted Abi (CAAX) family protease
MKLESAVQANPAVARFVQANPNDPQVRDFKALSDLASEVEQYLSPLGVRRADWQRNAENVAAVTACEGSRVGQVACALGSYKTILPRIGNDNYARVLLKAGAGGVMIRTNQVPAKMPGIEPLAAGP